ncbi:DUF3800 domain-containing protein [Nissabacter archeti]|uniref:DUF3800 domain-containing protein n=1 Tax=Nissabacter archeti TaxID=1917880 RepID=UPI00093311C0|nr:DUF3800 domain-containing protein [Nissabacter archeti]
MSTETLNIYCDESCHLLNDHLGVMVLGALYCPNEITQKIARDIRVIKKRHGLHQGFEIKWTKVSLSKVEFYLDIFEYFFSEQHLQFRAVIIPNKEILDHNSFSQDHNTFYYKMFYYVLKNIIQKGHCHRIYLDIKDTLGTEKINKLREVLHNSHHDFSQECIERIQHVRSHEVEHLQLTDLFIGAMGYVHRGLTGNAGKIQLIDYIKNRTGLLLTQSTSTAYKKFNIFVWEPQKRCL